MGGLPLKVELTRELLTSSRHGLILVRGSFSRISKPTDIKASEYRNQRTWLLHAWSRNGFIRSCSRSDVWELSLHSSGIDSRFGAWFGQIRASALQNGKYIGAFSRSDVTPRGLSLSVVVVVGGW